MNPFPANLEFENAGVIRGRQHIRLTREFTAITSLGTIRVPAGTLSDGASIPQAAMSIVGDRFDYLREATVHDHLYSPNNRTFTRAQADLILRELMWNVGIPAWKVSAFWLAVRIGGRRAYKARISKMETPTP